MQTKDLLSKRITLCNNLRERSYRYITLFEALNSIRVGVYQKEIDKVRDSYAVEGPYSDSYRRKKKNLPAFLFSGSISGSGFKFDLYGYTSLVVADIDNIDDPESVREAFRNDPFVVACWLSPSGKGLKALFYVEYDHVLPPKDMWIYHEHCAFTKIAEYIRAVYKIDIDMTGSDITRFCFVSADAQIHLKSEFEPLRISEILSRKKVERIRHAYNHSRRNIIKARKEEKKIAKLIRESKEIL